MTKVAICNIYLSEKLRLSIIYFSTFISEINMILKHKLNNNSLQLELEQIILQFYY